MSKPRQPNVTCVANGMFIVRTQAGFRKALKCVCDDPSTLKEVPNYPKSYPALVSISVGYCGYEYMHVNVVPLDKLKDKLREQAELF
jgi:hypothetical protein